MRMHNPTFHAVIVFPNGTVVQHGFHLGTIERTAREIVEESLPKHLAYKGFQSIALYSGRLLYDVYNGSSWTGLNP